MLYHSRQLNTTDRSSICSAICFKFVSVILLQVDCNCIQCNCMNRNIVNGLNRSEQFLKICLKNCSANVVFNFDFSFVYNLKVAFLKMIQIA